VGIVKGRIKVHSKNFRPGNSQQATSQAHVTPIKVDKIAVLKTKINVEKI
tara:strand:+ start:1890 stop:2039 length:150 start_codon:yes stop_codon:yes gene_type:complete